MRRAARDMWMRRRSHRRCTAHAKSTGERCKRWAIKGGFVCHCHGGNAPQVRGKANLRLAMKHVLPQMIEQQQRTLDVWQRTVIPPDVELPDD